MATDELYLDNLDEYINDENRIITYKWLSVTLKVHVNLAKQMLYNFVQIQRNTKENDELTVTYFVSGVSKGDDGAVCCRCLLAKETDLDAVKASFFVVTSCHVYSVQKVKLKDSTALYSADYDCVRENLLQSNSYSAIKFPRAIPLTCADLQKLSINTEPKVEEVKQPTKITNGSTSSNAPAKKPAAASKPKNSIAGMFDKAIKKKDTVVAKNEPENKIKKSKVETKSKPAKKKNDVSSFFPKQSVLKPKPVEISNKTSPSNEGKSKKTKANDSGDESGPEKKRRRRIRDIFDSSSEEEMEEEQYVPSPPREPSPKPVHVSETESDPESPVHNKIQEAKKSEPTNQSRTNEQRSRKRTRKLVPKTFMDDDGYMVTEKVWESDSTDASEVEEPKKPAIKPPAKPQETKKKVSPSNKSSPSKAPGKQTSMMSFFKKK